MSHFNSIFETFLSYFPTHFGISRARTQITGNLFSVHSLLFLPARKLIQTFCVNSESLRLIVSGFKNLVLHRVTSKCNNTIWENWNDCTLVRLESLINSLFFSAECQGCLVFRQCFHWRWPPVNTTPKRVFRRCQSRSI